MPGVARGAEPRRGPAGRQILDPPARLAHEVVVRGGRRVVARHAPFEVGDADPALLGEPLEVPVHGPQADARQHLAHAREDAVGARVLDPGAAHRLEHDRELAGTAPRARTLSRHRGPSGAPPRPPRDRPRRPPGSRAPPRAAARAPDSSDAPPPERAGSRPRSAGAPPPRAGSARTARPRASPPSAAPPRTRPPRRARRPPRASRARRSRSGG